MKDLSRYNYNELVEKTTELLKDKEGWGDAYQSSVGQTLIQLLADTTDNLHYLLERRTIEGFLHHARIESSIISRASEMGYRIKRATSHTGVLKLTILDTVGNPSPPIFKVVLPKFTKFTMDQRIFYSAEAVMMGKTQTSVNITVKEGVYKEKRYDISALNAMGEIVIRDWQRIDDISLSVRVGDAEWGDVRSLDDVNKRALSFAGTTDELYDVKFSTEGMHIVFGDDWFGKKPDATIILSYIEVQDTNPIYRTDQDFAPIIPVTDADDETIVYEVDIKNITAISGGTDTETIESIRNNATIYNQTNGRGVTNTDYSFWAKRAGIGSLIDVKAFGEEEINTYVHNLNNVFINYAKGDYSTLSPHERNQLRKYLDNVKTTQAHLVITPAIVYKVIIDAAVRKYANIPIADSHMYFLIRNFINEQFSVKDGSIGYDYHNTDIVNKFYGIKFDDNGVKKPLVDYVRWDMRIGIDYNFPSPARSVTVGVKTEVLDSLPVGEWWIINIDGVVCKVQILPEDNSVTLMRRMRDVVRELTDVDAKVVIEGAAIDDNGYFVPVEIEPDIGYHLLIGTDSSNKSIEDMITPVTIGTAVAYPSISAESFSIKHFYYNPKAGFRPTIPMRDATTVTYTPVDTRVEVWIKPSYKDNTPYELYKTIEIGEYYSETFTKDQLFRFKFLNDSTSDTEVDIHYSNWNGVKIGLSLNHINKQSLIDVDVAVGGFGSSSYIQYETVATRPRKLMRNRKMVILPNTVQIHDADGKVIVNDDGKGMFGDDGSVDYYSGVICPPTWTYDRNDYTITYKQDEFSNIMLGDGDILQLDSIPEELVGRDPLNKLNVSGSTII